MSGFKNRPVSIDAGDYLPLQTEKNMFAIKVIFITLLRLMGVHFSIV